MIGILGAQPLATDKESIIFAALKVIRDMYDDGIINQVHSVIQDNLIVLVGNNEFNDFNRF